MIKSAHQLTAYDYLLRGRYYFKDWKGARQDVLKARAMFEKSIELAPMYAAAYSALAATHLRELEESWSKTPELAGQRAIELARKAIDLDPGESHAHLILAAAYFRVKGDFEMAKNQIQTAIEVNPNYYWNYCFKCWFSTCAGDLDEGISCGMEAIRRNPLLPDPCLRNIGFAEYLAGRYDEAVATFTRMSNPAPDAEACLAACYAQLGDYEQARKAAAEFRNRALDDPALVRSEGSVDWRTYWSNKFNFKNETALEHLLDGMRKVELSGASNAHRSRE